MSKTLKFTPSLSFPQLVTTITTFGADVSVLIASEPGVGKSSLLPAIAEFHGDKWRKPGDYFPDDKYVYVYVDCPMMDFADFGMRIPSHDTKTLLFYPSSLFHMDDPRPKVIMFDERFKALKALQPMFTRADLERTIGDTPLPKGSIVFSTTNNASDGVGDNILAHSANRLMQVQMRKPTVDEWCAWATENGLDSRLRAAVALNPLLRLEHLLVLLEGAGVIARERDSRPPPRSGVIGESVCRARASTVDKHQSRTYRRAPRHNRPRVPAPIVERCAQPRRTASAMARPTSAVPAPKNSLSPRS